MKTALREFHEFQAKSPIWRLGLMALAYTIVYLIARWGMSIALGVFQNIWIAGAAAAFVAAVIVAPNLFSGLAGKIKRTGVRVKTKTEE